MTITTLNFSLGFRKAYVFRPFKSEACLTLLPKLRKITHEERLRIARLISDRVVEKHGTDIHAVYVCGSTSKKLDRPFSDLEFIVVVRDGIEMTMKYYLHKELIIQIQYLESSDILKAAEQFTLNWHWEADQYRNRIALYERDGWFRKLDDAIAKNDKADSAEALRDAFMMMTESRAFLKNAVLTKDKIGVFSGGRTTAEDAARIVFFLNRTYVTTTSWFWRMAFDAAKKPKDFRALVEKACGITSKTPNEVIAASEKLYQEMYELVRADGVEIERDNLWV